MNNFQKTKYFNKTFGIVVNEDYDSKIFSEKWGLVKYRLDLINEELTELEEGCEKSDFLEILDAISDLLYVSYGLGNSIGLSLDVEFKKKFSNSDKSNFQLVKQIFSSQDDGSSFTGKIEEPYFTAIKEIVKQIRESYNKLFQLCNNFKNETSDQSQELITQVVIDIIYFCYLIGCWIKVDVDYVFNLVHEANMTKACSTEQIAKETVEKYLAEKAAFKSDKSDEEYPYQFPAYRPSDDGKFWIVFNDDKRENPKFAGKILKAHNWREADFSEFKV